MAAVFPGSSVLVQAIGFTANNATFTGLNGGVNFPSGAVVVVCAGGQMQAGATAVIGGVDSLTEVARSSAGRSVLFAGIMTGSRADSVVLTNPIDNINNLGVASCYMTGVSLPASATGNNADTGTAGNPQVLTSAITNPASGIGIFAGGTICGQVALTLSNCLNASPDVISSNPSDFGSIQCFLGQTATAGSWNPGVTGTGVEYASALAAATFNSSGAPGAAIAGITKNNAGQVLGSCDVFLLQYDSGSTTLTQRDYQVSNSSTGVYSFTPPDGTATYMVMSFKDGSPNVFDVTDHNLQQA